MGSFGILRRDVARCNYSTQLDEFVLVTPRPGHWLSAGSGNTSRFEASFRRILHLPANANGAGKFYELNDSQARFWMYGMILSSRDHAWSGWERTHTQSRCESESGATCIRLLTGPFPLLK